MFEGNPKMAALQDLKPYGKNGINKIQLYQDIINIYRTMGKW